MIKKKIKKRKKTKKENYISLREATKYCVYSQEYLSLRARKGKLKAVKKGRNWVTTLPWLLDYLKRVENYKNNLLVRKYNKEAPVKIKIKETEKINESVFSEIKESKKIPPPANIPLAEFKPREKFSPFLNFSFKFGLTFALIFILFLTVFFIQKKHIQNFSLNIYKYTYIIGKAESSMLKLINENLRDYFKWLGENINEIKFHLNKDI